MGEEGAVRSVILVRMSRAVLLWVCLVVSCQTLAQTPPPYSQTLTQNGTSVTVNVQHVDQAKTASDPLREFENVLVQIRFSDVATGSPITGGSPAAWIDRRPSSQKTTPEHCVGKIKRFAEGSTFSRTELDLTSYFVVIMNGDPTLTVVDPRFGYGDTRLLAMVPLDGPGEDWVLTGDGHRLFVSVPAAGQVVAVDTAAWKVVSTASSIPQASSIALQPDEGYLWVAYGTQGEDSGVVVLDPQDMKVAARIRTGSGYHHMTFSADSSFAFVTNPREGTVSVIDVRRLSKVVDVPVGDGPTWIAYSDLAKAAYVANEGDGKIVVIDATGHQIRATMSAAAGLGQIRFAPGGRFALVVNPSNDFIYVVDASSNRIVQQGKLDKGPDQIAFTNKEAHIRHRGSDAVLMIALASLGRPDARDIGRRFLRRPTCPGSDVPANSGRRHRASIWRKRGLGGQSRRQIGVLLYGGERGPNGQLQQLRTRTKGCSLGGPQSSRTLTRLVRNDHNTAGRGYIRPRSASRPAANSLLP